MYLNVNQVHGSLTRLRKQSNPPSDFNILFDGGCAAPPSLFCSTVIKALLLLPEKSLLRCYLAYVNAMKGGLKNDVVGAGKLTLHHI